MAVTMRSTSSRVRARPVGALGLGKMIPPAAWPPGW
ncbi:Uncharacterised protein [Bordetella pertussis]|nr:Uncharacterised protein [Bordetella pertussis]